MTWAWQPLLPGAAQLLGGAAPVSGVATQTLAPYGKTQTGKVIAAAVATQTLGPYGKTQTGTLISAANPSSRKKRQNETRRVMPAVR